MFNKYYQIKSCYERENKDSKQNEVVIIANEVKWKWLLSSYNNYFIFTPEEFVKKFWTKIKNDVYNKWLERLNIEVWCEIINDVHWVIDNLPAELN